MVGIYLVALMIAFSVLYALQLYYPKIGSLKILALTILFVVSSGIYFSFETFKGWPSDANPPEGSDVLGIMVVQPSGGSDGAIYVWVTHPVEVPSAFDNMTSYIPPGLVPRGYVLPYTEQAGEEYEAANKKLKKGFKVQIGEPGNNRSADTEGNGEGGKGNGDEQEYKVPHLQVASPQESLRK